MNLAIALSAARYGTVVTNYTEVVRLLKTKDPQSGKEKVCGASCRDVITGKELRCEEMTQASVFLKPCFIFTPVISMMTSDGYQSSQSFPHFKFEHILLSK